MGRQSLHYFLEGNTAHGFRNFYEDNLRNMKRIYYLNLLPGMNPTDKLNEIGQMLEKSYYTVEYVHHALCAQRLKGIIVPELRIAIMDICALKYTKSYAPGLMDKVVDFESCVSMKELGFYEDEVRGLKKKIEKLYENLFFVFGEALKVHDEWESVYIENVDFGRIDELTDKLTEEIFEDKHMNRKASSVNRFFGAATCNGTKDFVPNIIEDINRRYYIKGRPGSGKSTMMKKINRKANALGFSTEVYHCGFDANSVDMVLIPQISTVIFDSTAPHEYFPERAQDIVVDVYDIAINPDTDEVNSERIANIQRQYKEYVVGGTRMLAEIFVIEKELNQIYSCHVNNNKVNKVIGNIEKGFNWI